MNTSEDYSQCTEYAGATDEDLEWFEKFSFWIEGVFQLGIGKFLIIIFLQILESYTLGVKIRNLKVDFKTGGTWHRVGQ